MIVLVARLKLHDAATSWYRVWSRGYHLQWRGSTRSVCTWLGGLTSNYTYIGFERVPVIDACVPTTDNLGTVVQQGQDRVAVKISKSEARTIVRCLCPLHPGEPRVKDIQYCKCSYDGVAVMSYIHSTYLQPILIELPAG
jgi:hypothetical protein